MSKLLAVIGAACVAVVAALSAVQAGEPAHATSAIYVPSEGARDALFQRISHKPCCYNNGRFANSTPATCRRYGGRVVAYEYCEQQYEQGWQGGPYGGQWNNNYGYNFNPDKPCCYNNGQYYNSTPKTCRRYGGQTMPQEYCAWAYNGGGYSRQRQNW